MNEIFQYFGDVLLVTVRDSLILLLDEFLKIQLGCSLALAIPRSRQKFTTIYFSYIRINGTGNWKYQRLNESMHAVTHCRNIQFYQIQIVSHICRQANMIIFVLPVIQTNSLYLIVYNLRQR